MSEKPEETTNKGGRPTKCTPELTAEFVRLMEAGNYFECACAYCGIPERTAYRWIEWGDAALVEAEGDLEQVPEAKLPYARFCHATQQAGARAEIRLAARIQLAAQQEVEGDWRAGSWFLEKRFQRRWGMKTETHELSGPGGAAMEVNVHDEATARAILNDPAIRDAAVALAAACVAQDTDAEPAGPDPD